MCIVLLVGGHVVPFQHRCANLGAHKLHEDVTVSEEDWMALVPVLLKCPELFNLGGRDMVVCDGGVAPQVAVDLGCCWVEGGRRVALEVRECAIQWDLGIFEYLAQCTVADPVRRRKVLVLAQAAGSLLRHFSYSRVGEGEAGTTVGKLDVIDEQMLPNVVGLAVIELAEELEEVVPPEVRVCLNEDIPLGVGLLFQGLVDHRQELPLIQLPAGIVRAQIIALRRPRHGRLNLLMLYTPSSMLL